MKNNKGLIAAALFMAVLTVAIRYTVFRDPPTIRWGDDLAKEAGTYKAGTHYEMIAVRYGGAKAYELGLRADGVVVWREVKP